MEGSGKSDGSRRPPDRPEDSLGSGDTALASSDTVLAGQETDEQQLSATTIPVTQEAARRYRLVDAKSGRPTSSEKRAELAQGGMGRILCAFDTHTGREVVVKERLVDGAEYVSPESQRSGATTPADARFLYEARITARLEHPNIVPVYEVGKREDGRLYYTMRRVRGKTLEEALSECESLAERMEFLPHFLNLCNAIAYAHSKGVIHRDIKPHNVMVSTFGETVVLDWGLAKIVGSDPDERDRELKERLTTIMSADSGTVEGYAIGTPSYMPPEQAEGDIPKMDTRSDVYSLGAVLYEILTGRPPFKKKTFFETVAEVLHGEPVPIRKLERKVPKDLAQIAGTAMSKDRDLRYLSAATMARAVQAYLSGKFVPTPEGDTLAWLRYLWREKRKPLLLTLALVAVALLAVLLHSSRVSDLQHWISVATDEIRRVGQELEEQKAQTKKLEAELIARQAEAYSRSAAGFAAAAYAVAMDDTPDFRVRLYTEAVARSYGLAVGGLDVAAACAIVQSPFRAADKADLACVALAQPAGETGQAAIRTDYSPVMFKIDPEMAREPLAFNIHYKAARTALMPDGAIAIMDTSGDVHVVDREVKNETLFHAHAEQQGAAALAASPSGRLVAADEEGNLFVMQDPPVKLRKPPLSSAVRLLVFAAEDLYVLGEGGEAVYYADADSRPLAAGRVCQGKGPVKAAAARIGADGTARVAAACTGNLVEINAAEAGTIRRDASFYLPSPLPVSCMDLALDASSVVMGTASGDLVEILLDPDGFSGRMVAAHTGPVESVAFSGDGMLTSGADGLIKRWPGRGLVGHGPAYIPPTGVEGRVLDLGPGGEVLLLKGGCLVVKNLALWTDEHKHCSKDLAAAGLLGGGQAALALRGDGTVEKVPLTAGQDRQPAVWPSPLPSADRVWVQERAGSTVAVLGNPEGEFALFDYLSGKEIGWKRKWGNGPIAQALVDPFKVNLAVLYENGRVAVGGVTADAPLWDSKSIGARHMGTAPDGRWIVMADPEGRLWGADFAGKGEIIRPCELQGSKAPEVTPERPASCFGGTGIKGILAMVSLSGERMLLVGGDGFVIYDIRQGSALVQVPVTPFDEARVDAYGRSILWVTPKAEGLNVMSLLPVGKWLFDPPEEWIHKVMSATGYTLKDGVIQPMAPEDWHALQ